MDVVSRGLEDVEFGAPADVAGNTLEIAIRHVGQVYGRFRFQFRFQVPVRMPNQNPEQERGTLNRRYQLQLIGPKAL